MQVKVMANDFEQKSKKYRPKKAIHMQRGVGQTPKMIGHICYSDLRTKHIEWARQELTKKDINHDQVAAKGIEVSRIWLSNMMHTSSWEA